MIIFPRRLSWAGTVAPKCRMLRAYIVKQMMTLFIKVKSLSFLCFFMDLDFVSVHKFCIYEVLISDYN